MSVKADIATVQKYVGPGTVSQIQRAYEFFGSNQDVQVRIGTCAVEGFVGGMIAGAAAGAVIGIPFGASAILAKGGAAIGGSVFMGLSIRYEILKYKSSAVYSDWLQKATAEKVYPIFQKYLHDEHLEEFLCPLSGKLIQTPMKDQKGNVYEAARIQKAFAEEAIVNQEGVKTISCLNPKGNGVEGASHVQVLKFENFSYDLNYHTRLIAALKPKFLQASLDPTVLAGLKAIRAHIIEERANMLKASIDNQIKGAVEGSISKDDLLSRIGEQYDRLKIS
jgi:hypothetical protein